MATKTAEDLLRDGREALSLADWDRARCCFERAAELDESAEVLDGLSQALHFQGEFVRAIELKERAFAAYRRRGKRVEAAELARWLAFLHASVNDNVAAANGWMARAESLLKGLRACAAHGWLTLALLGEAYVASGRVVEGMTLLDQAMAAVSGGEVVGHGAVGEIYCRLMSACEHVADVRRAEQWMALVDRFVVWRHFVPPTCRSHYGGILIALGRWTEAEQELLAAVGAFEHGYRASRVLPLVRLADLRVRQGRFEEAERLLEGNEWHPTARRSQAAIARARGDLALAEDLTRVCLEGDDPSDPACAPLLELLVGIRLARDDLGGARETLDRLAELATSSGHARVGACAELAAGRVRAAEADERAAGHLKTAVERFSALNLPLETARAQLALAAAVASTAPGAAIAEARVALGAFERLGALSDADEAAGLLRRLGAPGRARRKGSGVLTKRETEVLSLLTAGYTNAEIGGRLVISRRTAEHHVASILSKLGLRSRAEAAAYAVRQPPEEQ